MQNASAQKASLHIDKKHQTTIDETVLIEAKTYAQRNLPGLNEPSLDPYTTSIRGKYIMLVNEVKVLLKGDQQKALGSVNLATSNQQIENANTILKSEINQCNDLRCDLARYNNNHAYREYQKQRFLLWFFSIAECAWTTMAFLKFGEILILAALIGLGIGLAQIIITIRAIQIIKEIEDARRRRFYLYVFAAGTIVISLVMGVLRYYFAQGDSASSIPFLGLNPFTFAAFNLVLILATTLTVYYYYPSKGELKRINKAKDIEKAIVKKERRIKLYNTELRELQNDRELIMELHATAEHDEKKLLQKINGCFDEAIGQFKHYNITMRHDGQFPQAFSFTIQTLFTYSS